MTSPTINGAATDMNSMCRNGVLRYKPAKAILCRVISQIYWRNKGLI